MAVEWIAAWIERIACRMGGMQAQRQHQHTHLFEHRTPGSLLQSGHVQVQGSGDTVSTRALCRPKSPTGARIPRTRVNAASWSLGVSEAPAASQTPPLVRSQLC